MGRDRCPGATDGRVLHRLVRLCHDGQLVAMVGRPSVENIEERYVTVPLGVELAHVADSVTLDGRQFDDWIAAGMPATDSLLLNADGLEVESAVERLEFEDGLLTVCLATH